MDRVVVQPIDKDRFRVYEDYHYWGVCVPKGFVTNGADIPRVFWSIFPPNSPEYLSAVVLHDYMCANVGKNRGTPQSGALGVLKGRSPSSQRRTSFVCEDKYSYEMADRYFYEAMIEIGVAKWKAKLFYISCRIYHRFK